MTPAKCLVVATLIASVGCASSATAAVPRAGKFQGVTSQKNRMMLDVRKRHGKVRVASVDLPLSLICEDGSSVDRTVLLGEVRVSRRGSFRLEETSGGNYGPDGKISMTVVMRGHFTSANAAEGTFTANATVFQSEVFPAYSCSSGTIGWASRR